MHSFSTIFHKALDAITPSCVTPYEQELIDEARTTPYFREGQIVAAYTGPCQGILIAYGRITGMVWSETWEAWGYDVITLNGATIYQPSYCLREVGPDEARLLFVRVYGGKQ